MNRHPPRPKKSTNAAEPVVEGKGLLIHGLPSTADAKYVSSFTSLYGVASGKDGKLLITVFPLKEGQQYKSARVTFTSVDYARNFKAGWDKLCPPNSTHPMNIRFWQKERKQFSDPLVLENRPDNSKTIVRNVLYVQGIHKKVTNTDLSEIIENLFGKKPHKVKIYQYEDGGSQGRGSISFKEASDAEKCLSLLDGAKFEGSNVSLTLVPFETTKIKRLSTAIGNEDLWRNSTGSAYECLDCHRIFDERDMKGCVPIGHEAAEQTHFLCQDCVRRAAEAILKGGKQLGRHGTGFPCPQNDCKRVLLWAPVKEILTNRTSAAKLDQKMTKAALKDIEGMEYCKDCEFGAFLEQDTQRMQYFSCENPKCRSQFCRICKVSIHEHLEFTCEEMNLHRRLRNL